MTSFPENWMKKDLETCVEILDNKRIPVNSDERAKRQGDIPYYGATGQAGWIDDFIFNDELVLVGEDGAPFFEKEKNVAFLITGKSWVNNHAHVLKAINGVTLNKFVLHYLNHFDYKDFVGGTTRLKLNQGSLRKIPIPLPPLPEQKRIVAKLDNLFAHLDQLKARLQNIPTLLKQFRQAVLTQAVTGKLTEEWREKNSLENASITIDRIKTEQRRLISLGKLKKEKDFGQILDNDIPFDIPKSWTWSRWNDILAHNNHSMKRGPFGSTLKKEFFVAKGVRVFEQYNPINDDPYWVRYYIDVEKYNDLKDFTAKAGDLLISCSGVTLGRITELPLDVESGIINQALLKLELHKDLIINAYFIKLFRSEFIQDRIFDQAQGTAIPNMVGVAELKKMLLPIPPLEEQKEIVRRVESLFAMADRIEANYTKLQEKIDHLPQAILSKAFRGELVEIEELEGIGI